LEDYVANSKGLFSEYLKDLDVEPGVSRRLFDVFHNAGTQSESESACCWTDVDVVREVLSDVDKSIIKLAVSRDKALTTRSPKEYER
jgi:hypothetical protein